MLVIKFDNIRNEDKDFLRKRIWASLVGKSGFIDNEIMVTNDCEICIGDINENNNLEIRVNLATYKE